MASSKRIEFATREGSLVRGDFLKAEERSRSRYARRLQPAEGAHWALCAEERRIPPVPYDKRSFGSNDGMPATKST
jgi:hypothetical protein